MPVGGGVGRFIQSQRSERDVADSRSAVQPCADVFVGQYQPTGTEKLPTKYLVSLYLSLCRRLGLNPGAGVAGGGVSHGPRRPGEGERAESERDERE